MNKEELSKIIAYDNGDLLDVVKVRQALFVYWSFSAAEKRCFDRLMLRMDLKERFDKEIIGNEPE